VTTQLLSTHRSVLKARVLSPDLASPDHLAALPDPVRSGVDITDLDVAQAGAGGVSAAPAQEPSRRRKTSLFIAPPPR